MNHNLNHGPDPEDKEDDPSTWPDNCREEIKEGMPYEDRVLAAEKLGPNWANIMSGLGDQ